MNQNEESMQEELFDEEWIVKLNTGGQYSLSKKQAWVIQEAIANGNRGIIMFKTFSIPMPYIAEFYRKARFLNKDHQLTASQKEEAWTEADRLHAVDRMKELREKYNKIIEHTTVAGFKGDEVREKEYFGGR